LFAHFSIWGYRWSLPDDGKQIAVNKERKIMHLLLLPVLADDAMIAPSGAVVIVILTVLAVLRGR
jgi:hypothetical protein